MSFYPRGRVPVAPLLRTFSHRPWSVTRMRFKANPRDMNMALNGMEKANVIYRAFDRGSEIVGLTLRWFDFALGRLKVCSPES